MLKMLKITNMKLQEAEQIARIANECGLSFWSEGDYRIETKRENSFVKTARFGAETVGFIVARLIMSKPFEPDNSQVSALDFPLIKVYKNKKTKSNKTNQTSKNMENAPSKIEKVEIEIYNVAVKTAYQRRGVGFALLDALIKFAAIYKTATIWLEVRESNDKAINFYKANKFEICYKRKNFYNNPPEDGIVMKLETENSKAQNTEQNSEKQNLPPESNLR